MVEESGKELHSSRVRWVAMQQGWGERYIHVADKENLFAVLREIREEVAEAGVRPILHFEMHGCKEGLELESGEIVAWNELCDHLRIINTILDNTLLVVLAACYGGEIYSQIQPLLVSPFRCVVAPDEKMSFGEIAEGFDAFYEALPNGLIEAIGALNNHQYDYGFKYTDITHTFLLAWNALVQEYNTLDKIQQLAEYLIEIKRIDPSTSLTEARDNIAHILLFGSPDVKWQVYRKFMRAESLPDEGFGVLYDTGW